MCKLHGQTYTALFYEVEVIIFDKVYSEIEGVEAVAVGASDPSSLLSSKYVVTTDKVSK